MSKISVLSGIVALTQVRGMFVVSLCTSTSRLASAKLSDVLETQSA
jgi:hypothetical protein